MAEQPKDAGGFRPGSNATGMVRADRYAGSKHLGILPTGCIQCREGAKLVLFVTGLCDKECFYCPVSRDRMYQDVVFANERRIPLDDFDQIIDEANLIDAKGAGITGGDPMVVPRRTIAMIRRLKEHFGPQFHIHLYTSCEFDTKHIAALKDAGLDEIRFHPEVGEYGRMETSWHHAAIQEALRVGLTTMVEIPCIPDKLASLLKLCHYLDGMGAHGINLNELEFSDPNVKQLRAFGYEPANDEDQRVLGSRETAMALLDAWKQTGSKMPVHFCSSPYKDAVQLMQRFRRRAQNTKREFEEMTEQGTLVFAEIPSELPGELAEYLRSEYEVPIEWIAVVGNTVQTAPWVMEELYDAGVVAEEGWEGFLVEVHPTSGRIETERATFDAVWGDPFGMEAA